MRRFADFFETPQPTLEPQEAENPVERPDIKRYALPFYDVGIFILGVGAAIILLLLDAAS
jgi:hypothetical protein